MQKKYLFFVFFGIVCLFLFFYPSYLAYKINDFANQVFYSLKKESLSPSDLVIVEIDEKTLKKINSKWPFSRAFHAQALKKLQKCNPKVVGFDIAFVGKSDDPAEDRKFAKILAKFNSPVVLAYFLDKSGKPIYPQKDLKNNAHVGFINVSPSEDRIIRYARGYFKRDGFSDFSWSVKISSYFNNIKPKKNDNQIIVNNARIPIEKNGIFSINYFFKPKDFKAISFSDLLSDNFQPNLFSKKIVLFSSILDITHDIHSTPLGKMPGVYIHANIIFDILNQKLIKKLPSIVNIFILVAIFLTVGYFFFNYTFLRCIFLSLGSLLFLFWIDLGLKSIGYQIAYGKIVFTTLTFILLGTFYIYASFLSALAKIKNRAVIDPLTGFYNIRYFFEYLSLDVKKIPKTKKYMAIVCLENFQNASVDLDFSEIKSFWLKIKNIVFTQSKVWCTYSNEIILGKINSKESVEDLKNKIQSLLSDSQIKSNAKVAIVPIKQEILKKDNLSTLIEKIYKSKESITVFRKEDLARLKQGKIKVSDFLSSLYVDTTEKNQKLLLNIKKLKKEQKKTKKAYLQLISSLIAALESKDPYTQGHTDRVCRYSLILANKINLSEEEKENIKKAALLHDLGKIGISDFILHKKGKLSKEEFKVIKTHQSVSAKILEPIDEFNDIIPYILHHHENFDGTGYPHGLGGEFIPLGARIIAVADVFDALITGRDYKKAYSPEKSVKILQEMKGKRLDPELVNSFIQALKDVRIIN